MGGVIEIVEIDDYGQLTNGYTSTFPATIGC